MSNLDDRYRDEDGQIRKKRGDTKVETLKETYSEFEGINGNKLLKTLEKELGTDSLNSTLKKLRENSK
jgi:hypothetical protein